jgi:hypothetical protein
MPAAVPTPRPATAPAVDEPAGRHRRALTLRSCLARVAETTGRLGSAVSLAALLVLAATAGGLADGMPATGEATVTVTFDGNGR